MSDTGIGIPESKLEQIFHSFEQVDASTERDFGGSGLGLAISRQLVELHGGRLWVESTLGEGSRFSFTVALSQYEAEQETADVSSLSLSSRLTPLVEMPVPDGEPATASDVGDKEAYRILVVDDEPVIREVLANQLRPEGYNITTAPGGEEALLALETETIDLVLLDVMMPRMSGFEVCRSIRETRSREQLPALFLTAKNQVADLAAGFEQGANDYLTKPIAKSELLARVRTHLDLLATNRKQMEQVKILRGLLPICSMCKKIRDEDGYWTQIEHYIGSHSEAAFSHGICQSCATENFADLLE